MTTSARPRLPRAEREQRILDAAAHEFDQHGFRGASMERIAHGAGITKALVYQYFASFDQLDEMRNNSCVLYRDAPNRAVDEMQRR